MELNSNGSVKQLHNNFVGSTGNNLGLTSQGDSEVFPGTIWIGTLNGAIRVMEPNDYDGDREIVCLAPDHPDFDPWADYDGDCFTNQDEIDNGTDYCASNSFPADNDRDCISDLFDPDDDNDFIVDFIDPYQMDLWTNNGLKNHMPYRLDISGSAGFGFFNVGFTGLMTNMKPDDFYRNWLDDPEMTKPDEKDIVGGAVGVATIFMTEGDALTNNQRKGLQFGVNVSQASGDIIINARLIPPFFDPKHQGNGRESYGFFIGNGDQDNYIKLVRVAEGLQVMMEDKGQATSFSPQAMPLMPTESMDLYFICKKESGQMQAAYAVNGGDMQLLGTPFQAPSSVGNIIKGEVKALAVGIIGTTGGGGNAKFAANYDYFDVKGVNPELAAAVRFNAGGGQLSTGGLNFGADQYFSGGGTYTATGITDIAGTNSKELYFTERYGKFSYNVPLGSGTYLLRLHFAEIFWKNAGQRVFNVNAEGKAILTNYDIVAETGYATAAVKEFEVAVTDGTLNLDFVSVVENAKVSAIEILQGQPLSVNAGPDKSIVLPVNSTSFTATVTGGGTAESWLWEKISGPSAVMAGTNTATLSLSDLLQGNSVFKVTVWDNRGGKATDEVALTVDAAPTGFAAPSNLTATGVSASQINLGWADNSSDETGFVLERSTSSAFSGSVAIISLPANTTSYQDKNKKAGVTFYYRIKAVKGTQESDWSNVATGLAVAASATARTGDVQAYPNTFNDHVNLHFSEEDEQKEYEVEIYDLLGKMLFQSKIQSTSFNENRCRLDLSDHTYKPGNMYLIRISTRDKSFNEVIKVVKKL